MNRCLTLVLLFVIVGCSFAQFVRKPPKQKIPEVDEDCMNCICQASSNCDEKLACHNSGESYFCGPYVVSWAYWFDGGKPGNKGGPHDFEKCLNNKTCAEEAVRGYMRKYGQDCDRNGKVDCLDFAKIHKLGYGACGGDGIYNTEYWDKFEICYLGYPPADDGAYPAGNDGAYPADNNAAYPPDNDGGYPPYPAGNDEGIYNYGEGSIQARNGHAN